MISLPVTQGSDIQPPIDTTDYAYLDTITSASSMQSLKPAQDPISSSTSLENIPVESPKPDHLRLLEFNFASDTVVASSLILALPEESTKESSETNQSMETSPTDNPEANKATPLGRSRRASIASMLMRRSSRSIENNINLANEPEVKALEDKIELDFDTAKQNKAQDPILDDSVAVATDVNDPVNIEPEALVPDQQTPKDTTTPVESPAEDPVEPATDTQPTATSPATPAAVIATASVTNNEPAPVDSTPFDSNPVDSTSGIQESSSESSLQESTTDSHTKISNVHKDQPTVNEQETTLFPESIDEIEPPMDDGLSRRSSRIFLGLSRKVQNVRQSASMALKRSMGSRLSVTVPSGTHTFESSVPLEEQNQESANVSLDTPVDIPVDIPVDTPVESNVQTLEPTGDTDVLENDISEDSSMKPEVEVTGTNRGLNVKRRLTLVKRGTNEAVRNGVSRVKSIFTSKRPPVTA